MQLFSKKLPICNLLTIIIKEHNSSEMNFCSSTAKLAEKGTKQSIAIVKDVLAKTSRLIANVCQSQAPGTILEF